MHLVYVIQAQAVMFRINNTLAVFAQNIDFYENMVQWNPDLRDIYLRDSPYLKDKSSADRFSLKYINYPHLRNYPNLRDDLLLKERSLK